jgi:hypothetical protein
MPDTNGGQAVVVPVGSCLCPGAPHTTDTVSLAARPSLRLGLAANAAIGAADGSIQLQEMLGAVFVRYGVIDWNVVDEKGKPVPVTPDAVEARLTWDRGGLEVANAASDLYTEAIIAPLVKGLSSSQEPGPTEPSTSPTPPSPWSPRTSSEPSLPASSVPGT